MDLSKWSGFVGEGRYAIFDVATLKCLTYVDPPFGGRGDVIGAYAARHIPKLDNPLLLEVFSCMIRGNCGTSERWLRQTPISSSTLTVGGRCLQKVNKYMTIPF